MSLRLQRVQELLKRELGEIIRREFPVEDGSLINVNEVKVSKDLQIATVYIGIIGKEEQKRRNLQLLLDNRKRIQGLLGKAVVLKYTPQLRFIMDESIERGNRVLEILDELDNSSPST